MTLEQEFDGLRSSLSVSDLSGKDRFPTCSTPVLLEVLVAEHCFGCAAQRDVPRRISRLGFRPQFAALFIHDASPQTIT